jgi:1,4-dihydroxy-2-naphthoyl-CoA synthase
LKVRRDGNVVVLTMNNPQRKNALTPAMITLMAQAWDEIDADDGIRAAISPERDPPTASGATGEVVSGLAVVGLALRLRVG